jgi:hypothetical protein
MPLPHHLTASKAKIVLKSIRKIHDHTPLTTLQKMMAERREMVRQWKGERNQPLSWQGKNSQRTNLRDRRVERGLRGWVRALILFDEG